MISVNKYSLKLAWFLFVLQVQDGVGLGLFNVAGVLPLSKHDLALDMIVAEKGYKFFCDYVKDQGGFSIRHALNEVFTDSNGEPYMFAFNCQIEDNEGDEPQHIDITNSFIKEGNIDFFVGGHIVFEEDSRILINSAERILFECCVGPDSMYEELDLEYLFGIQVSNSEYTDLFIKELADKNITRIALISQERNEFTETTCRAAAKKAERAGIEVVKEETFSKVDITDLETLMTQFVNGSCAEKAEAIIGCVQVDDGKMLTEIVYKQQYPLKALFVTTAPWYDSFHEDLGRNVSIHTLSAGQYHWGVNYSDPTFENNSNYVQLYTSKYGEKPNYVAALASAVMETYMLVIQSAFVGCDVTLTAGNTKKLLYDPLAIDCGEGQQGIIGYQKVYEYLLTFNKQLFMGPVGFNNVRRNNIMDPVTIQVQEVQDGQLDDVAVLPRQVANGELILPQPNKFPSNTPQVCTGLGNCSSCSIENPWMPVQIYPSNSTQQTPSEGAPVSPPPPTPPACPDQEFDQLSCDRVVSLNLCEEDFIADDGYCRNSCGACDT